MVLLSQALASVLCFSVAAQAALAIRRRKAHKIPTPPTILTALYTGGGACSTTARRGVPLDVSRLRCREQHANRKRL